MAGEVERESIAEQELARVLGRQAAPGVYLAGQRLGATQAWTDDTTTQDVLFLQFEGNWSLRIRGMFEVELVENKTFIKLPGAEDDNTIEGEIIEETDLEKRVRGKN